MDQAPILKMLKNQHLLIAIAVLGVGSAVTCLLLVFSERTNSAGVSRLGAELQESGDGKHVVTGSFDMTAILWEAASGQKLQTFQGHTDLVTSVALSGDGKHVVTGSENTTAILWDAAGGKPLQTFQGQCCGRTNLLLCPVPSYFRQ